MLHAAKSTYFLSLGFSSYVFFLILSRPLTLLNSLAYRIHCLSWLSHPVSSSLWSSELMHGPIRRSTQNCIVVSDVILVQFQPIWPSLLSMHVRCCSKARSCLPHSNVGCTTLKAVDCPPLLSRATTEVALRITRKEQFDVG